jgi:hypothetical protein
VTVTLGTGDLATVSVDCPDGKRVIGGGVRASGDRFELVESYPSSDSEWRNTLRSDQPTTVQDTVEAYAVCVNVD